MQVPQFVEHAIQVDTMACTGILYVII